VRSTIDREPCRNPGRRKIKHPENPAKADQTNIFNSNPPATAMPRSNKRTITIPNRIREAVSGPGSPGEQEVAGLVPGELLRMAKAWRKDPEGGMKGVE
jgi:hypothetical protein